LLAAYITRLISDIQDATKIFLALKAENSGRGNVTLHPMDAVNRLRSCFHIEKIIK